MRLEVERTKICIIPESPQDEAYIEEVLHLRKHDDICGFRRVDVMGGIGLAYIETTDYSFCEVPR